MILSFYRSTVGVLRQRRGAVMMMFAMALPVLTFAIGMGIDYARAMKAQTKMNAVADSAALSAVSKVATAMRWPMPAKSSMRRRCRSSMPAISLSPT
jgi:Flp pilus assembly protein TadG